MANSLIVLATCPSLFKITLDLSQKAKKQCLKCLIRSIIIFSLTEATVSSQIISEEYTTQERTVTLNTSLSVKGRLVVVGGKGGGIGDLILR